MNKLSRKLSNSNNNGKTASITVFIVSLAVFASLLGLFGEVGQAINRFLIGVFGLAVYPYVIIAGAFSLMSAIGRKINCSVGQAIRYFGTVLFIIFTFHAITSNALVENNTFFSYILACYEQANTAGGLLLAPIAYPLLNLSYALALVVFIGLTLLFGAMAILPEVNRGTRSRSHSVKLNQRRNRPTPVDFNSYGDGEVESVDVGSELFVSNLSGDKNGDKILRQKGNLNVNYDFLHPNRLDEDDLEDVRAVERDSDEPQSPEDKKRQAYDVLFNFQNSYESKDYGREIESEIKKATAYPDPTDSRDDVEEKRNKLNSFLLYQDSDPMSYTNNYRRNELNNGRKSADSIANYISKYDELFSQNKKEEEKEEEKVEPASSSFVDENPTLDSYLEEPQIAEAPESDVSEKKEKGEIKNSLFDIFSRPSKSVEDDFVKKEEKEEPKPLGIFDLNLGQSADEEESVDEFESEEPYQDEPYEEEAQIVERPEIKEEKILPPVAEKKTFTNLKAPAGFVKHAESVAKAEERVEEKIAEEKVEKRPPMKPYVAPPIELLGNYAPENDSESEYEVAMNSEQIIQTLGDFNIPATVSGVTRGSSFTRYEIQIDRKVSVNTVNRYINDIAMKLRAPSIRIEAPIPGMDAVGVEVPNKVRSKVGVKSIIESGEFFKHKSPVAFTLGEDITGKGHICDIADMPHLLVAGATGSGKSVCINSLIISLIYKSSPEDVRLILIDPKHVELSVFNGLPHMLLKEVVCEPDKALNAFSWAVDEMMNRYKLFESIQVRNIKEYNEVVVADKSAPKLPYIVIVCDELCDLMQAAKRDLEEKIKRLAQLSRAAGIHLVLATQRPSVDVITGTIKANLPSRIAFSVTSFTDSKTILDYGGADKLLGKGDMLFMRNGRMTRLQGPLLENKEVRDIVEYVKSHNTAYFDPAIDKIINAVKEEDDSAMIGEPTKENDLDDKFIPALKFLLSTNVASISSLSTRFAIGYNRAARIIFQMEKLGYVSRNEGGNKGRKLLITREEFEEIFGESADEDYDD